MKRNLIFKWNSINSFVHFVGSANAGARFRSLSLCLMLFFFHYLLSQINGGDGRRPCALRLVQKFICSVTFSLIKLCAS